MTEHATEAVHEPAGDHGGHHDTPEAIAAEKRRYMIVFGMLGILTILTVTVSRMHFPHPIAIAIALIIAIVKGSLVAAYFMHLISERRLVFAVLTLTVFFFGVLMWGPWHHHYDSMGHDLNQPGVIDTTHTTEKTH